MPAHHDGSSFLVGLIGHGIQASLSPTLHERAGARHGFKYLYRLIDLEVLGLEPSALPQLLASAEQMGYCGLNVTHPCKQAVIPHLDELSAEARTIGAVNTVVFHKGRRVGHNTDCWGFAQAFRHGAQGARLDKVVQLGAGGAGAAVAHAVLDLGAQRLMITDLNRERAEHLVAELCRNFGPGRAVVIEDIAAAMRDADGLIHATPTGMANHPGLPLRAELLTPSHWVAEIVYFPLETELVRLARQLGCRTLDGSGMAVYQAVGAFRLFTGVLPDVEHMRRDFDQLVATRRIRATEISAAAQ
jgi:shikimate dehydrogenase